MRYHAYHLAKLKTCPKTVNKFSRSLDQCRKVKGSLKEKNNNDDDQNKMEISVYDCLFVFEVRAGVNEEFPLIAILSTVERASCERKLFELQLSTNDNFFEYNTAKEFKNPCINTLKNVRMALIHQVTRINDPNEQMKLMQKYHGDRIRGGHCGQERLYAKL